MPNVTVLIGYIEGKTSKPEYQLKDVKKLHDFKFINYGLEAWKIAGVGNGILIDLVSEQNKLKPLGSKYVYRIANEHQLENFVPRRQTILPLEKGGVTKVQDSYEFEDEDEVDYIGTSNNGAIFTCPNNLCTAQFILYDRYTKHLLSDNCKIKVQNETIEEQVKTMYLSAFGVGCSEKLEKNREVKEMVAHLTGYPEPKGCGILKESTKYAPLSIPRHQLFGMGFALQKSKEKTRFKSNVLDYVKKIFEDGRRKGKKATAQEVMLKMRKEKIDGKLVFDSSEWLSEQQIRSLFCRFAAKVKKGQSITPESIENTESTEEEEEANLSAAKTVADMTYGIMDKFENDEVPDINDHPLRVGEISLCDLAKSLNICDDVYKVFKKIKTKELKQIIEFINSDELRGKRFYGKDDYENRQIFSQVLHEFVKEKCGCIY